MSLRELFYNPYTRISGNRGIRRGQTQVGLQMPNHDNHLHVASDNEDEMKQIMDKANSYGLTVHENPYATSKGWDPDGVQPVHAKNSNHYITLGVGNVGGAADISGDPKKIIDFIDSYLYKQIYPNGKSPSSKSLNTTLSSGSTITTDDSYEGPSKDSGGQSSSSSSTSTGNSYKDIVRDFLSSNSKGFISSAKPTNEEMELPVDETPTSLSGNKYVYNNRKVDNRLYSPYDGLVDSVNKNTNDEYVIVVIHKYSEGGKNDKLISTISGFSKINPNLSAGYKIKNGDLIGYMDDGDTLVWTLTDNNGKSVKIKDYLENNQDKNKKDIDTSYSPRLDKAPGLLKFTLNYLNPFKIPFGVAKAAKKIGYQKESTQENKVLTEEIQRIKNLMK